MPTYPVDVEPEQIVKWVMAEHRMRPSALKIAARRTVEERAIPLRKELHLGDDDREDLSEIAVNAILEVAPANASDGWLLKVLVEDESGPRPAYPQADAQPEQQIDIGTFYKEFMRSGRGTATVIAEVENSGAERRIRRLLDDVIVNRHAADGNT